MKNIIKEFYEKLSKNKSQNKTSKDKTISKNDVDGVTPTRGFKVANRFDEIEKRRKRSIAKIFDEFLEKSGNDNTPKEYNMEIIRISIIITLVLSIGAVIYSLFQNHPILFTLFALFLSLTIGFAVIYLISLLIAFFYLDIKMYQRTKEIEKVLPDFLQLAAANISAGMPIDRALWFAVKPRFGVLAKEVEEIAKSTIAGDDLEEALIKFTKKYDSKILKESMNLIVAGIRSGGELADLLGKISSNIQKTNIMKKEISASVMTYVIFISVASMIAAPVLFALSTQLLSVVRTITSSINLDSSANSGFNMSFSSEGISTADFGLFAMTLVAITNIFSVMIISVIQKGDAKAGLKNIPFAVIVAILLYYGSSTLLGNLLGSIF